MKNNVKCYVRMNSLDAEGVLFVGADREAAIRWVDDLLDCVAHFHLLGVLNDLQSDDEGNIVFASKWDIPLRIVNMALAPYRLVLVEHQG